MTSPSITERYLGATVEIPGGSVELGLQRQVGEPIHWLRSEAKRIVAECALELNGDDVDDDSAPRLIDRMAAWFDETWPQRAYFLEVWNASERLVQTFHRWKWPGDEIATREAG